MTALAFPPPGALAKKHILEQIEDGNGDAVALTSSTLRLILQRLDHTQLPCPWPKCGWTEETQGRDRLPTHLRESHGTHELFWTPLIIKHIDHTMRNPTEAMLPGQVISDAPPPVRAESGAFILRRDVTPSESTPDTFATNLRFKCEKVRSALKKG